jgi:hypothetical protein
VSSGHIWTTCCSFSYFTSLFLEESNNTEARTGRGRGRLRQVRKIERTRPQGIEALPVEVIGMIFSHVKSVEEVVRASGTCRKWRRAVRYHWHHLKYSEEGFGCVQKSHNCRPGSVAHADYPANVFSANFEPLD